jgi:hypothetical protein
MQLPYLQKRRNERGKKKKDATHSMMQGGKKFSFRPFERISANP